MFFAYISLKTIKMKKDKKRIKLGITLPESLIEKVSELEKTEMINKSKLIEKLLADYLDNPPK